MTRNAVRSVRSLNNNRKTRRASRKTGRRRVVGPETLEQRCLLAPLVADVLSGSVDTTVLGTVYEDLNSNGARDGGENGVSGWKVYLDLDHSGTWNTDAAGDQEPAATTNQDGDFVIRSLVPGTYRVAEVVQDGWVATAPVSRDVAVVQSHDTRVDFFNFSGGDVVGTVWNDVNEDGVRDSGSEPGLAGWTVFLDLNTDGLRGADEPTVETAADGTYAFRELPPGDYEVTEVLPDGWDIAPGFDSKQTAAVVARQQVVQDFANFSTTNGSIQGTVWNDLNADGTRGVDPITGAFVEPGLADWTVFVDVNHSGGLDAGEPTTTTNADGHYTFVSLAAGDYEITELLPDGWDVSPTFDVRQTVAVSGGAVTTAADFANFTTRNGSIRGLVWNDVNRNGVRDANPLTGAWLDPGLASWTVFLDRNANHLFDAGEPTTLTDAAGGYAFADLQIGDYEVQEILPSGWEAAPTFSDSQTVTVYSGTETVANDFANYDASAASPGSVAGVVWNDANGNGIREATESGLSGWTVFLDQNSDGVVTAGEPTASSASDGAYSFGNVAAGTVRIVLQPTIG